MKRKIEEEIKNKQPCAEIEELISFAKNNLATCVKSIKQKLKKLLKMIQEVKFNKKKKKIIFDYPLLLLIKTGKLKV